jgi:heme-degrading monooxygenase HmoA
MVIVLIRTRMREGADRAAYEALSAEMFALVSAMPGFVGAASYGAEGDDIGVIRFESLEALRAWRELPRHVAAQELGRSTFYASYTIEVCEVVRAYDFNLG